MVVASYGQCPYCHERRANAEALKFLCLLEYEGKVIFFRPAVHFFSSFPELLFCIRVVFNKKILNSFLLFVSTGTTIAEGRRRYATRKQDNGRRQYEINHRQL